MVLCQVQNTRIIAWLKTSCQINGGAFSGQVCLFWYVFSVDTQMPLPYTFSARIEFLSKDQRGEPYPILGAQALNSLI